MSLTTYQSKFVLVGGRNRSTCEVNNTLHTSTTGQKWEPSLPPMPTKRHGAFSVSTTSPEMLVVAGGVGLHGEVLDVVEVLLEDKWTSVDPLPAPYYWMHTTFHDGNLYFMAGGKQGTTVYTCSCSSLNSSVTESASTTSMNSPLWRQYHEVCECTNVVSFSSRLTKIDGQGLVRGYCNITRSWVEATCTGDIPHKDTADIAATVHSGTGDIIYCHKHGGVYRVSLSGEKIIIYSMYTLIGTLLYYF